MGFQDRAYYRDSDEPTSSSGGFRMRMWSVTTWLIAVNVAVFVVDALLGKMNMRVDAGIGPQSPLAALGHFSLALGIMHGQVWRLVTFQFLHAGPWHLFFNMLSLYFFGPMIEQYLGSRRYLLFYLLCGIGGAVAYPLLLVTGVLFNSPWTPLVGASAGIFGILLAAAKVAPNARVMLLFPPIPMQLRTMAWIMVGVAAYMVLLNGDNAGGEAAHLGGAVAGYILIRRLRWLNVADLGRSAGFVDRWKQRQKQAQQQQRHNLDAEVDRILDKVRRHGLQSLTSREKKTLNAATERKKHAG
ncbi:MAG: rhomboid family intramembrane serine protease [Phycisphaeraceae bacterium]|nr:rhomboid family intramembrane serine protease [Phycisphaeraceae bacterium]